MRSRIGFALKRWFASPPPPGASHPIHATTAAVMVAASQWTIAQGTTFHHKKVKILLCTGTPGPQQCACRPVSHFGATDTGGDPRVYGPCSTLHDEGNHKSLQIAEGNPK